MTRPRALDALGLTPQQYAQQMDRAKEEAVRLRRQAIDAFTAMLLNRARSAIGAWRRRALGAPAARGVGEPCRR
jgi:hypothetical protein